MDNNIGDKMKKLRIARNLTQQEVADMLGVSKQHISRWEAGVREIRSTQLIDYAKAMGVTLDYFSDSTPERTLFQTLAQLEAVFTSANIPEVDKDKAYQDVMRMYLKSKEQRAAGIKSAVTPVSESEIMNIKEE